MKKSVLAAATATVLGAILLSGLGGCANRLLHASEAPAPVPMGQPAYPMNGALATPTGMTLYSFDKDTVNSGASTCSGPCAALWPPYMAAADAAPVGNFTVITRDDGAKQWAYKGWPLYVYSKDVRAGDATGDNFKNIWHVVKP